MDVVVEKAWESKIQNIVPCSSCNGAGCVVRENLISYHNNDYEYYNEVCGKCDGEGRMLETNYRVKISVNVHKSHETVDFSKSYYEKLIGRKTEEIYKIKK
jgi:DnaJ-class molecular chaperone